MLGASHLRAEGWVLKIQGLHRGVGVWGSGLRSGFIGFRARGFGACPKGPRTCQSYTYPKPCTLSTVTQIPST